MLVLLVGISRALGGILTAVEFIGSVGYLHRDITPENILVSEDGEGVLADFGLCITKESAFLPANIGVGNVDYSAMEVATTGSCLCSDLFSISVCFLESMLGRNPFDGKVCNTRTIARRAATLSVSNRVEGRNWLYIAQTFGAESVSLVPSTLIGR